MKLKILSGSIVVAVLIAAFLTWWPEIVELRRGVPVEGLSLSDPDYCERIWKARPWYSTINVWFWLLLAMPFLGLIYRGRSCWRYRTLVYFFGCTFIGYILNFLSVDLSGEIVNGPFTVYSYKRLDEVFDLAGHDCHSPGGGFQMVFALYMGWLLPLIYIAICFGFYLVAKVLIRLSRRNHST